MDCVLKESKERPTIFHTSMTSIAQMFSKCHSAYEWNWETVSSLLFHNFAFFLMSFSLTIVCVCVVSVCYIGLYGLSVTQRESDMNTIGPENQNRFDFAKCTLSQRKTRCRNMRMKNGNSSWRLYKHCLSLCVSIWYWWQWAVVVVKWELNVQREMLNAFGRVFLHLTFQRRNDLVKKCFVGCFFYFVWPSNT